MSHPRMVSLRYYNLCYGSTGYVVSMTNILLSIFLFILFSIERVTIHIVYVENLYTNIICYLYDMINAVKERFNNILSRSFMGYAIFYFPTDMNVTCSSDTCFGLLHVTCCQQSSVQITLTV